MCNSVPMCKRRQDKSEKAIAEAIRLGIRPEIFAAVDGDAFRRNNGGAIECSGRTLILSWDAPWGRRTRCLRGAGNLETAWGTLGCCMSHERVLQRAEPGPILVLGDDIYVPAEANKAILTEVMSHLAAKFPDWQLLMLGCKPRNKFAAKTRNKYVAPRACPPSRAAFIEHIKAGSAADCALECYMRKNVGKCFMVWPPLFRQNKKLQSDIRQSVVEHRTAAPRVIGRSTAYVANLKAALPQCRCTRATSRGQWLHKVRKSMKTAKRKRWRGSTTMCAKPYPKCRGGQAKPPAPDLVSIIIKRFGQKTALCRSCQTRLREVL